MFLEHHSFEGIPGRNAERVEGNTLKDKLLLETLKIPREQSVH